MPQIINTSYSWWTFGLFSIWGAMTNNATVNTFSYISFDKFMYVFLLGRSGLIELYFGFSEYYQTIFHHSDTSLHLQKQYMRFLLALQTCQFLKKILCIILILFKFS